MLVEERRRTEHNSVFVASHLRHFWTAPAQQGHTYAHQADGQLSGNDRAALLKVDATRAAENVYLSIFITFRFLAALL